MDRLTHSIDIKHIDVRRSHEQVLNERSDHMPWLELHRHRNLDIVEEDPRKTLTKIRLAIKYKPSVAKRDNTIFLKIGFVKMSLNVRGPLE